MELLRWKTRIAVLWIIMAVSMSVFMFLSFMEPGAIEGIIAGRFEGLQIGEGLLIWLASYWFIPWIMAWVSLTLKDAANRWLNFVIGILFGIVLVIGEIVQFIGGKSTVLLADYLLAIVAAALIAWYAWKWPKQEE